jgi:hypothetical protein
MPRTDVPATRAGLPPKIPSDYKIRFTSAARRARAFRKLGVSADQVASATQIMPFLKGGRGGIKAVLGAMRFSQDAVVKCFLAKHDSLGVWARENTCWEAIALAAGVDLPYLLGAALLARRDDATTRAKLLAICSRSGTDEKANRVRQTPRRMARSGCPRKASSRIALNFWFFPASIDCTCPKTLKFDRALDFCTASALLFSSAATALADYACAWKAFPPA